MTRIGLLRRTIDRLTRAAAESPRSTAQWLLAEALGIPPLSLYLEPERTISPDCLHRVEAWTARCVEGEPLAYVLGSVEFAGQRFCVTPSTLIPRPETELLLEAATELLETLPPGPVLDVGTGSGALAISLACRATDRRVYASDLDPSALAVAEENARGRAKIIFYQADLLHPAPEAAFALIVANLPYIPTSELARLPRNVRYEPRKALDGGPDGLRLIRSLIAQAAGRSRALALEVGDGQAEKVGPLLDHAGFFRSRSLKDLTGMTRIVVGESRG
ncbi:peptide chain release factor N(5)-glutamine methyltransferase [Methylacidimicrobium sp. B4]|uniref:peptide chain release factor N(5)-glutamine methyltransferase n=1 Tax=Methylacidimicrobium sp. B4 TaxID=2796139 RepID=UPI001A902FD2|nr:peptide chain release factor N(5)-glutamine methyltransferase [Methylacidimicrobium sp. B4]QSR84532.1 peptide chain release factor N(5)-glutamine methyltransferase [Methylacidimicrobium sp. B4]